MQLDRTFGPLVVRGCPQLVGWTGTAEECIETLTASYWNVNGDEPGGEKIHDPCGVPGLMLADYSDALRAPFFWGVQGQPRLAGDVQPYGGRGMDRLPYVQNSFENNCKGVIDAGIGTMPKIRSISLGDYWGTRECQRMLMSADQIKTSADKVEVNFRKTWGRILVN